MTYQPHRQERLQSPSPRRAWIEIFIPSVSRYLLGVALPTEGVD